MNPITPRPADRPKSRRPRVGLRLEALEKRELMNTDFGPLYADFRNINFGLINSPSPFKRIVQQDYPIVTVDRPIGVSPHQLSWLDNDGKVITGVDREGDQWTLTLHGPGAMIVTDATPNDGILDDDLDTIQIIGSDLNRTYVTGSVVSSDRTFTDGQVRFNRLIALDGVASVVLNGFTLAQTTFPPAGTSNNIGAEVQLLGGVRTLSFTAIESLQDLGADDRPIEVVVGDPNTPLRVRPNIRIDHVFNTVVNTATGVVNDVPVTTPTVIIAVNGTVHKFETVSATSAPLSAGTLNVLRPAGSRPLVNSVTEPYLGYQQAVISPVAITGRTSLRANGIVGMKAVGSLINTTASRTAQPFTQPFSGLRQIGHAYSGGNADALGLDVSEGQIGRLRFARGLGGPGGAINALPYSGTPIGKRGYPAFGLQGGVIAARRLGDLTAAPSTLVLQTSQDPSNVQRLTTNATEYFARPGDALIGAAVTTDGQIRRAHLVGNLRESRISSGFNYRSYIQGLDPTRQPSAIEHYDQRGDLVNSVVTASYRSSNGVFGGENDQAGRGLIRGNLRGNLYNTRKTPGGIQDIAGAGFFARRKIGYLPPVESSPRVQSVLRRV